MKNTILTILSFTLLSAPLLAQPTTPTTPTAPTPNAGKVERHPVMNKAIKHLKKIKGNLQTDASHDFQGHRVKAMQLIDQAISELQQGVQSDTK